MKVYLSKQAEDKLQKLLEYLLEKWNVQVRNDFLEKLIAKLNQISIYPESCPKSEDFAGLHKCVLSKQTTFYYRVKNTTEIEVITFFDSRQNPEKLKKEL